MLRARVESQELPLGDRLHPDVKPLAGEMRKKIHTLEEQPANQANILKARLLAETIERFGTIISGRQKKAEARQFVHAYLEKVGREASLADYFRIWGETYRLGDAIIYDLPLTSSWENIHAKKIEMRTQEYEEDPSLMYGFPAGTPAAEAAKIEFDPKRIAKEWDFENFGEINTKEDFEQYLINMNIQRELNSARKYGFEDPEAFTYHEFQERKNYHDRIFKRDEKKPEINKKDTAPVSPKTPGDHSEAVLSELFDDLKKAYPEGVSKEEREAAVDLILDFRRQRKICNIPTYLKIDFEAQRMITAIRMALPVRATFKQIAVINDRRMARAKSDANYPDDQPESIPEDLRQKYNIHDLSAMLENSDGLECEIDDALRMAKTLGLDPLTVPYGQFMEKVFEAQALKKKGVLKRVRDLMGF